MNRLENLQTDFLTLGTTNTHVNPEQYRKAGAAIHLVGPRPRPCRSLVQLALRAQACSVQRATPGSPTDPAVRERLFDQFIAPRGLDQLWVGRWKREFTHVLRCIVKRPHHGLQDTFPRADTPVPQS